MIIMMIMIMRIRIKIMIMMMMMMMMMMMRMRFWYFWQDIANVSQLTRPSFFVLMKTGQLWRTAGKQVDDSRVRSLSLWDAHKPRNVKLYQLCWCENQTTDSGTMGTCPQRQEGWAWNSRSEHRFQLFLSTNINHPFLRIPSPG